MANLSLQVLCGVLIVGMLLLVLTEAGAAGDVADDVCETRACHVDHSALAELPTLQEDEEEDQALLQTGKLHRISRMGIPFAAGSGKGPVARADPVLEPNAHPHVSSTAGQGKAHAVFSASPFTGMAASHHVMGATSIDAATIMEHMSCLGGMTNCALKGMSMLALLAMAWLIRVQRKVSDTLKSVVPSEEADDLEKDQSSGAAADLLMQLAPQMPKPAPKLDQVGTSFIVPWSKITGCTAGNLNIDVPVLPAVWPLRASFRRAQERDTWARIELTVDIIDAAGLPPLLYCTPLEADMQADLDESTGGTGAAEDVSCAGSGERLPSGSQQSAWLEIRAGTGALAAVVTREAAGRCSVQRPGHPAWDIEMHLASEDYLIAVRRCGQDIGLAKVYTEDTSESEAESSCDSDKQRRARIETRVEASSPESVLLLMCMLAILSCEP